MNDSSTQPEELRPYFGKLPEVSLEKQIRAARIMKIMQIVKATMEQNVKKEAATWKMRLKILLYGKIKMVGL